MQAHQQHRKCSIFKHAKDGGHIVAIVRYGKKLNSGGAAAAVPPQDRRQIKNRHYKN